MYFFLEHEVGKLASGTVSEVKRARPAPWADLARTFGDQTEKIMPAFICSTCGTQFPPREASPAQCPVCEDERQYIPPEGQSWTTLVRGGGHFPGGAMLHWAAGADGKGVVCSADMAIANLDRKSFSFMRSIPNFIPLSAKAVRAVGAALMPLAFDRVYSHHWERVIQ